MVVGGLQSLVCGCLRGCRCDGVWVAVLVAVSECASLAAFCRRTPRFGGPRDIFCWERKSPKVWLRPGSSGTGAVGRNRLGVCVVKSGFLASVSTSASSRPCFLLEATAWAIAERARAIGTLRNPALPQHSPLLRRERVSSATGRSLHHAPRKTPAPRAAHNNNPRRLGQGREHRVPEGEGCGIRLVAPSSTRAPSAPIDCEDRSKYH